MPLVGSNLYRSTVEQKSVINYSWEDYAACRNLSEEKKSDFFPSREEGLAKLMKKQVRNARSVCLECPVIYDCLHAALVTNEKHGIWALSTPKQRIVLRRSKDKDGNPMYMDIENIPILFEQMIGDMTI